MIIELEVSANKVVIHVERLLVTIFVLFCCCCCQMVKENCGMKMQLSFGKEAHQFKLIDNVVDVIENYC